MNIPMNPITCPICAARAIPDPAAHADLALDEAPKHYEVLRCGGCGLRWMSPHPTPDDYQTIYDHDYYESAQEGGFTYRDEKRELVPCYTRITRRFRTLGVAGGLVDIGCGTGDFLEVARAAGLAGEGIEPSRYAAEKARSRGFLVHEGLLSDVRAQGLRYHAAHCSHVLEHVPDAGPFLDDLRAILEPGAPVYIEVPLQFDGILDRLNRLRRTRRKYSDFSIHHHYFFTPEALHRLLPAHGFVVLDLTTFLPCRRASRRAGPRKWALQSLLWLADRFARRGDVISVWARRVA